MENLFGDLAFSNCDIPQRIRTSRFVRFRRIVKKESQLQAIYHRVSFIIIALALFEASVWFSWGFTEDRNNLVRRQYLTSRVSSHKTFNSRTNNEISSDLFGSGSACCSSFSSDFFHCSTTRDPSVLEKIETRLAIESLQLRKEALEKFHKRNSNTLVDHTFPPTTSFDPYLPFTPNGLDMSGWPFMPPPTNGATTGMDGSCGSASLSPDMLMTSPPSSWLDKSELQTNTMGTANTNDLSVPFFGGGGRPPQHLPSAAAAAALHPANNNNTQQPGQFFDFDQIASGLIAPPPIPPGGMMIPDLPLSFFDLGVTVDGGGETSGRSLPSPCSVQSLFSRSDVCVSSVPSVDEPMRIDNPNNGDEMASFLKQSKTTNNTRANKKNNNNNKKKRRRPASSEDEDDDDDDDEEVDEAAVFEETDFFECGVRCTCIVVVNKSCGYDEPWIANAMEHVFVHGFEVDNGHVECNVTSDLEKALKGDEPKVRKRGRPPKKKQRCDIGITLGIDESKKNAFHVTVEIAKEDGQSLDHLTTFMNRESMCVLLRHVLCDNDVDIYGAVKNVSLIGVFESKLKAWEQFEEREEVRRKRKRDRERTRRLRKKKS